MTTHLSGRLLHALTCMLCVFLVVPPLPGSSTILDGVIVEVETDEDGEATGGSKVALKATFSPYCSETPLSNHLHHKTGHYKPFLHRLSDYKALFIDEVPVTPEQMAKVISAGHRATIFMNRKIPYFLRVEMRNSDSRIGFVESVSDDGATLVMRSPQHNHGPNLERVLESGHKWSSSAFTEPDGTTRFDDVHYPPFMHDLSIDKHTEIIGMDLKPKGSGVEAVREIIGQPVHYLPARLRQRVELLPENYGDWSLATENDNFLGNYLQQKFGVMGVMTSTGWDSTPVPQHNQDGTPSLRKDGSPRMVKGGLSYHMYRLLGLEAHGDNFGNREPGPYQVPVYHKGAWNIMDGFYANTSRYDFTHLMLRPGNFVVSTCRRTRLTPDTIMHSTEHPAAWGTITAIEGDVVTVTAPEIAEAPVSGVQQYTIDTDAEFIHLGKEIPRQQALALGSIIKVFAPHPARLHLGTPVAPPDEPKW